MDNIEKFKELLNRHVPLPSDLPVTFLEIAQMPHYEVVISRIYQFYLKDSEEHGFKDLFLGALIALIKHKWKDRTSKDVDFFDKAPPSWEVQIEVSTRKGNRIDILIEWEDHASKKYCIIIENKVFHMLRNDLTDYFATPQAPPERKIGVLLTLERQEANHEQFVNITHEEWLNEVKKRLGEYLMTGVDRHLFFIRDFILNLSKLTKNTKYMNEFAQFYFNHHTEVEQLIQARNTFVLEVFKAFESAGQLLGLKTGGKRAENYQYLIEEKGEIMFTLIFNPNNTVPFCIVYEVQGTKLMHKDALRENAKKLIEDERWSKTIWITLWGNASCAHILGKSCDSFGSGTQDIVSYFEEELKNTWRPIADALSAVYKNEETEKQ